MKKLQGKVSLLAAVAVMATSAFVTSCSSSDDNGGIDLPERGSIDAAVGMYKGSMRVYDDFTGTGKYEFFDVIIQVTKVDAQHVKVTAKSGEIYSRVTEKVMKVEGNYNNDITTVTGDLSGIFWYHADTKTMDVHTTKQAEGEIIYVFEGAKQAGK